MKKITVDFEKRAAELKRCGFEGEELVGMVVDTLIADNYRELKNYDNLVSLVGDAGISHINNNYLKLTGKAAARLYLEDRILGEKQYGYEDMAAKYATVYNSLI